MLGVSFNSLERSIIYISSSGCSLTIGSGSFIISLTIYPFDLNLNQ